MTGDSAALGGTAGTKSGVGGCDRLQGQGATGVGSGATLIAAGPDRDQT